MALDQGQTITIATQAHVYNESRRNDYRTERESVDPTPTGEESALIVDHTPSKKSNVGNDRHLHQFKENLTNDVTGEISPYTVNVTLSVPAWVTPAQRTRVCDALTGFMNWVGANSARTLRNES
jgi:hypothetical protein